MPVFLDTHENMIDRLAMSLPHAVRHIPFGE